MKGTLGSFFPMLLTIALIKPNQGQETENLPQPLYKYKFQTQDVMKTSASDIPMRGYHMAEGSYYPQGSRIPFGSESSGQLENFGGYQQGFLNHRPQLYPSFGGNGNFGHMNGNFGNFGSGGDYVDKKFYQNDQQQQQDAAFKKTKGNQGESLNQEQQGFNKGEVAVVDNKGDSGYYSDQKGAKESSEDNKQFSGAQHANQEGKNSQETKSQQGHRKGHVIKGYKTSHHKDESGKTEEYYDEANDQGNNENFKGSAGNFGSQQKSMVKGGQENGQFKADLNKKQGSYEQQLIKDNANGDKGQYGNRKFYTNAHLFGLNNGMDQQSLMGHQETNRFFKNYPYNTPFYTGHNFY